MMADQHERTFIMLKPDAVQRGLIGEITGRFERKGYKIVAAKFIKVTVGHIKEHYCNRAETPFFLEMCEYLSAHPVFTMVWEGLNVVQGARMLLGDTDPVKALPGSIRGDFSLQYHNSGRNVIHASDSIAEAHREIALWFNSEEIVDWHPSHNLYLYESQQRNVHIENGVPNLIHTLKATAKSDINMNGHVENAFDCHETKY